MMIINSMESCLESSFYLLRGVVARTTKYITQPMVVVCCVVQIQSNFIRAPEHMITDNNNKKKIRKSTFITYIFEL